MLILLDCRPLFAEGLDSERSNYIFSVAAALGRERAVKWLFLVDPSNRSELLPAIPGSSVLVHKTLPGRLGWRFWYDRLIPRLARRHRVDWIMLTGGVCAGPGPIPQCCWMPEKANPAEGTGYLSLYPRRWRDSLRQASLVLCFSEADKSWLAGREEGLGPDKIMAVSAWPSEEAAPLSIGEREAVRREYASGKEYFLADVMTSGEEEITRLLKSFSLFKKRQLSNLQLILTGRRPAADSGFSQRLETYKYRQDVHWNESAEAQKKLAGAAYALLFPFKKKTLGGPLLDAWKSEVPVIIGKDSGLQKWAGDAVYVADMGDPASLAGHLMTVYKDEQQRRQLIEKGLARAAAQEPRQSTMTGIAEGLERAVRRQTSGSIQ